MQELTPELKQSKIMKYTIYTISHPYTNEIVYVGMTERFDHRKRSHIQTRHKGPSSKYIDDLRAKYFYPKIEPIDQFDSYQEALYFEAYWIMQLLQWGFNLLNRIKLPYIKSKIYVKNKPILYHRPTIERKKIQKMWSIKDFELGVEHVFENRKSFMEGFRFHIKIFNLTKVYLFIKAENGSFIGTVVDKKPSIKGYKLNLSNDEIQRRSEQLRNFKINRRLS